MGELGEPRRRLADAVELVGHILSEQEGCGDGGLALASGWGARQELCEAAKALKDSLLRGLSPGSGSPPGERRLLAALRGFSSCRFLLRV